MMKYSCKQYSKIAQNLCRLHDNFFYLYMKHDAIQGWATLMIRVPHQATWQTVLPGGLI